MELNELLDYIDIDIKNSLIRFGNAEALYRKFLKKFVDDTTYDNICTAVKEINFERINEGAHTLKGVSGNLGLTSIFKISQAMMEESKNKNIERIEALYKDLSIEVSKTREILKEL